jgi:GR25 family glycosyltransferase involved in LPS biosynthesis
MFGFIQNNKMLFDKIIVINLDRSPNKKERIKVQLDRFNLDYIILPGFDGNLITNKSFDGLFKSGGYNFKVGTKIPLIKTHVACALSHVFAINMAKALKSNNVLILEDDITICDDFNDRMKILEESIPQDWQHVYLGGMIWEQFISTKKRSKYIYETGVVSGTHAYILNSNSYQKMSEHLSQMSNNVDGMMCEILVKKIIKSYMFIPFFAYQETMKSDIELGKMEDRSISKKFYSNKL